MKKILTILLFSLLLLSPIPSGYTYAEEETTDTTVEEETTTEDQETTEEEETEEDITTKETQAREYSFFTILGAILIPSILLIICYLILKFFSS